MTFSPTRVLRVCGRVLVAVVAVVGLSGLVGERVAHGVERGVAGGTQVSPAPAKIPAAAPVPEDPPLRYLPPQPVDPRPRSAAATDASGPVALAPDHVALTLKAAPSLFWYIEAPPREGARIVFRWYRRDRGEPLLEQKLPLPRRDGIQRLDLALLGLTLAPDVEYAWSITLRRDGAPPERDRVSTGWVRRVRHDGARSRPYDAAAYAEAGLWYDALEILSDAIDADAGDVGLREARDALLRQARLDAAPW